MIICGCPVQNRAWVLPYYLKYLSNLDYDKKEMILFFLVNDSTDDTYKILCNFRDKYQLEYHQIIIIDEKYGFKPDDRNSGRSGRRFEQFAYVRNRWVEHITGLQNIDYIFSVDSDILLHKNSLKRLISNDKDVCSMLINNMQSHVGYGRDCMNIMKLSRINQNKYEHILDYPIDKVFEVDVTGAAYLIKRKVFDNSRYASHGQGEDIGFCINARQNGYHVWCDSGLYGHHLMNEKMLKDFLAKGNEEIWS